jgi:hypothetical protein
LIFCGLKKPSHNPEKGVEIEFNSEDLQNGLTKKGLHLLKPFVVAAPPAEKNPDQFVYHLKLIYRLKAI